jgi:hypothetical protein
MIVTILVGVVCLATGFGIGRVKNSEKLAAIKAEVGRADAYISAEARTLASAIRAKL